MLLHLLALSSVAAVQVDAAGGCPTSAAVMKELGELGPATKETYRLAVLRNGSALALTLSDAKGATLAQKSIDANGTCAELAAVAAVTATAWLLELEAPASGVIETKPAGEPGGARAIEASPGDPPVVSVAPIKPAAEPVVEAAATTELPNSATALDRPASHRAARHEVAILGSSGFDTGLTSSNGVALSVAYWIIEGAALELHGRILDSSESSLMTQVRLNFPGVEPPLDGLTQLRSNFTVGGAFSIARAPVTLFGVTDTELELLAFAGVGAGETRRQRGTPPLETVESKAGMILSYGAGVRIYVVPTLLALRAELRDTFFPKQSDDPNASGLDDNVAFQIGLQLSTDPAAWEIRAIKPLAPPLERRLVFDFKVGTSLADTFVTTRSAGATAAYYFNDFFAVELAANYLSPTESTVTTELLDKGKLTPEVAQLTQLQWAAGAALRIDFFRGRYIPFGADFDGDFSLYGLAGAGIGATRVQCTPGLAIDPEVFGEGATCPMIEVGNLGEDLFQVVYEPSRTRALVELGFGARLGLGPVGVTIGIRDWFFNSTVKRPDTTEPTQRETSAGRHILLGELGVSFAI